ncbi:MAG: hypothetical protein AAFY20_03665 [Cyanobacteria bacterium J06639_14]
MANHVYPVRSFIKFKAKSQLIADLNGQVMTSFVQRQGAEHSTELITPEEAETTPHPDDGALTTGASTDQMFDEGLFQEIATIAFCSEHHPELYQPCLSQVVATEIEDRVATELIETYKRIKHRQGSALVQSLNALL